MVLDLGTILCCPSLKHYTVKGTDWEWTESYNLTSEDLGMEFHHVISQLLTSLPAMPLYLSNAKWGVALTAEEIQIKFGGAYLQAWYLGSWELWG